MVKVYFYSCTTVVLNRPIRSLDRRWLIFNDKLDEDAIQVFQLVDSNFDVKLSALCLFLLKRRASLSRVIPKTSLSRVIPKTLVSLLKVKLFFCSCQYCCMLWLDLKFRGLAKVGGLKVHVIKKRYVLAAVLTLQILCSTS